MAFMGGNGAAEDKAVPLQRLFWCLPKNGLR